MLERHCERTVSLAILCGMLTLAGCGQKSLRPDYASLGLVEVTGKITLNGEPVAGASITMTPPDSFSGSYGMTNAKGVYRMQYNSEQSGVTSGKKVVRVSTASAGVDQPPQIERIPARYNQKSELFAEIGQSGQQTLDFDLKTDETKTAAPPADLPVISR